MVSAPVPTRGTRTHRDTLPTGSAGAGLARGDNGDSGAPAKVRASACSRGDAWVLGRWRRAKEKVQERGGGPMVCCCRRAGEFGGTMTGCREVPGLCCLRPASVFAQRRGGSCLRSPAPCPGAHGGGSRSPGALQTRG